MGDKEHGLNEGQRDQKIGRRDAWCSFCRKNYREVGPLVEGPDYVYICYHCIRLCAGIIEKECQRLGVPVKE